MFYRLRKIRTPCSASSHGIGLFKGSYILGLGIFNQELYAAPKAKVIRLSPPEDVSCFEHCHARPLRQRGSIRLKTILPGIWTRCYAYLHCTEYWTVRREEPVIAKITTSSWDPPSFKPHFLNLDFLGVTAIAALQGVTANLYAHLGINLFATSWEPIFTFTFSCLQYPSTAKITYPELNAKHYPSFLDYADEAEEIKYNVCFTRHYFLSFSWL